MKNMQTTSWAGSAGIVTSLGMLRFIFQEVPLDEFISHAKSLDTGQFIDIVIPFIFGVFGIAYNEDKTAKK